MITKAEFCQKCGWLVDITLGCHVNNNSFSKTKDLYIIGLIIPLKLILIVEFGFII